MNRRGTAENLVAAHRGNTNAVRYGVSSPRLIQARADEIQERLVQQYAFSASELLALDEFTRLLALRNAMDNDLRERGLVDKKGDARHLVDRRLRLTRHIDHWLAKISPTIERQTAIARNQVPLDRDGLVTELQSIVQGPSANTSERLGAIKQLREMEADRKKTGGGTLRIDLPAPSGPPVPQKERAPNAGERDDTHTTENQDGLAPNGLRN